MAMLACIAMLSDDLTCLVESQQPVDLNRLGEHLPYEWIKTAIQARSWMSLISPCLDNVVLENRCAG